MVCADAALGSAWAEAEELRAELAEAEREGRELLQERRIAEEQERPLREWVQHVENQVTAARTENSRLAAALSSTLAFRASLLHDDSEAQPLRDAGMNVQQVRWLREHEQSCIARKAQLKEEIAAEEKRRDEFLKEAWKHRAIAEERQRQLGAASAANLPNILQTPEARQARQAAGSAISVLRSPKFPLLGLSRQSTRI